MILAQNQTNSAQGRKKRITPRLKRVWLLENRGILAKIARETKGPYGGPVNHSYVASIYWKRRAANRGAGPEIKRRLAQAGAPGFAPKNNKGAAA